jgi:hypothetical protein
MQTLGGSVGALASNSLTWAEVPDSHATAGVWESKQSLEEKEPYAWA